MGGKRLDWPEEHKDIVRNEYATSPTADIAKKTGKSVYQVRQMAMQLGIKKSREYLASVKKSNAKNFGKMWY